MSYGNRKRRREAGLLPEPVKCSARNRDGSPCKASPIRGATVCRMHGGASPQVLRKAKERLENSAEKMARLLLKMAEDPNVPHAVRLAAIRDALDRAGITARQTLEVEATWQLIIADIVTEAPDGTEVPDYVSNRTDPTQPPVVQGEVVEQVQDPELPGGEVEVFGGEVYDYNTGRPRRPTRRSDG